MNVEPVLIAGGSGIFDVTVDNQLVFSKLQVGDFPDEEQLVNELATQQAAKN